MQPPRRGARKPRPPRRDARRPLPVKIRLLTGSEPWVEIEVAGVKRRYPGHLAIVDIVLILSGWQ